MINVITIYIYSISYIRVMPEWYMFLADARIVPSFIRDFFCMIASKSPQANL